MKRSISMSLAGVAAATTLVAGIGTTAVFSDNERIDDNSLSSGTLDLVVGTDCADMNDDPAAGIIVDSTNFYPGQNTGGNLCVQNTGSLDGILEFRVEDYASREVVDAEGNVDCTEPEQKAEKTGPACGGVADGELGEQLTVTINDGGTDCKTPGALLYTGRIDDLNKGMDDVGYQLPLADGEQHCYLYDIQFNDLDDNNVAQSDIVTFDVKFDLSQDLEQVEQV